MKIPRLRSTRRCFCLVVLLALVPEFLFPQQSAVENREQLRAETQRKVSILAEQLAQVRAPTPLESQLQAACRTDCTAAADTGDGQTVAQELQKLESGKQAELDRVSAQIRSCVDDYVVHAVPGSDENLDREVVVQDLYQILSSVASQPPVAFVLHSGGRRALLVFYNLQKGTEGEHSSSAVLRAYNAGATGLTVSDATGSDMDGYAHTEVKELHSPVEGEIWLLVSGYRIGATGPNCRMRIFTYNGEKFRTTWMPANVHHAGDARGLRGRG